VRVRACVRACARVRVSESSSGLGRDRVELAREKETFFLVVSTGRAAAAVLERGPPTFRDDKDPPPKGRGGMDGRRRPPRKKLKKRNRQGPTSVAERRDKSWSGNDKRTSSGPATRGCLADFFWSSRGRGGARLLVTDRDRRWWPGRASNSPSIPTSHSRGHGQTHKHTQANTDMTFPRAILGPRRECCRRRPVSGAAGGGGKRDSLSLSLSL